MHGTGAARFRRPARRERELYERDFGEDPEKGHPAFRGGWLGKVTKESATELATRFFMKTAYAAQPRGKQRYAADAEGVIYGPDVPYARVYGFAASQSQRAQVHRQHERGLAEFAGDRETRGRSEAGVDEGLLVVDLGAGPHGTRHAAPLREDGGAAAAGGSPLRLPALLREPEPHLPARHRKLRLGRGRYPRHRGCPLPSGSCGPLPFEQAEHLAHETARLPTKPSYVFSVE